MRACARERFGSGELAGLAVAIAGLGHVGAALARRLADAGARARGLRHRLRASAALAEALGARWVEPERELLVECDILAPCALGGAIDARRRAAAALRDRLRVRQQPARRRRARGRARRARDPLRARLHRQRRRADPRLQGDPRLLRGARPRAGARDRGRARPGLRRWPRERDHTPLAAARRLAEERLGAAAGAQTDARWTRLWVVRLGRRPLRARRSAVQKPARARRAAPAEIPDLLLLLEHPPVYTRAAARPRTSCRWARTGTGCRGSRSARPTAAAASPTTAPASSSATRSSTCARCGDDVHVYVRRMERVMIAALGDYGVEAEMIEGLTGVWVGDAARRAEDRLDRRPRQPRGHHARLRGQRQQRPAAVRVDRPVRDRGLPDDLAHPRAGRRAGPRCDSRRRSRRRFAEVYERRAGRSVDASEVLAAGRRGGATVGADGDRGRRRPAPRHPLAGQPRRRDRDRGPAVPRAQAALAEGPGARRADLPAAEGGDRGRQPPHRLRGGELPERRRVLGARHGDVHDPRRRLHPPLRLLQRADGRADLERPARAAAGRQPGEEDGPAPRGGHLGRPRRPARLRRRAPSSA